jgi:tricarballylate dehydrogenase
MGDNWGRMKVRGTRYNRGKGLKAALAVGAQSYGNWTGGHAVPINAKAEDFGVLALGETTRRCLFQYGISINSEGKRFMDEGENKKVLMYGKTGLEVSKQRQSSAFQIFDAKIMTSNFEKLFYFSGNYFVANTLDELAEIIKVPKAAFLEEIQNYNQAIDTTRSFDTAILDGRCANGINPVRSNYADPIHMPPFFAFSVTGGITFTYGGIKINSNAEVLNQDDQPIHGLYAAGEMTGGFFMDAYPANAGLARGAVTGYLAGKSAARYVNAIGAQ